MGIGLKGLIWSFPVECLWCWLPPFPFCMGCGAHSPALGRSCTSPSNH